MDGKRIRFDDKTPLDTYDRLFEKTEPLPLLGRNDLELLFDYLFTHSLNSTKLKVEWDRASATGEHELFLCSLARVTGRRGLPIRIVRTKEDGTKIVTDLTKGFVDLLSLVQ